jgi:phosphatidylethanolamine/phosphatidyl-N-methylethanolamine N-methyltransferase
MPGASERALPGLPAAEPATRPDSSSESGYRILAPLYDVIFGLALHHGRRVGIAALQCQPGDLILELCIGSGLSLPLYPSDVTVAGVDLSTDMLEKSARRLRSMKSGPSCTLLRMNAERLAFGDGSFDKAVVLFGVSGLPDPVRALRELRRVCRPGATIVIANRFRTDRGWQRFFDVLLSPLYQLMRYRADIDGQALVAQAGLELVESRPVNLLGYSTVLVCRVN